MKVNIADIKQTFFVRVSLDHKRVSYFHEMLKGGETLTPVVVDAKTMELIDGRHRVAALVKYGATLTDVTYQDYADRKEQITAALAANSGGPMPSQNEDIYHVISQLFALKIARTEIVRIVSSALGVRDGMIKNAVTHVLGGMRKSQARLAAAEVTNSGKTVQEAAEKFGVDAKDVQAVLSGGIRRDTDAMGIKMSNTLSGTARTIGARLRKVSEAVTAGEMTLTEVSALLGRIEKHLTAISANYEDWKKRFETMGAQLSSKESKKTHSRRQGQRTTDPKAHEKKQLKSGTGAAGRALLESMGLDTKSDT